LRREFAYDTSDTSCNTCNTKGPERKTTERKVGGTFKAAAKKTPAKKKKKNKVIKIDDSDSDKAELTKMWWINRGYSSVVFPGFLSVAPSVYITPCLMFNFNQKWMSSWCLLVAIQESDAFNCSTIMFTFNSVAKREKLDGSNCAFTSWRLVVLGVEKALGKTGSMFA
jgi:hypothetical protein